MIETVLLQDTMGGSGWSSIIMMLLIFAIFYFFMIRPQTKKQKEIQNFRNALTIGDNVVTGGGIYGKIKEINDSYFVIEVDKNVNIRVDKNSVFQDTTNH